MIDGRVTDQNGRLLNLWDLSVSLSKVSGETQTILHASNSPGIEEEATISCERISLPTHGEATAKCRRSVVDHEEHAENNGGGITPSSQPN